MVSVVQGPPEKGQTFVLSSLIDSIAFFNQRILVLAPTNTVVGTIAKRLVASIRAGNVNSSVRLDKICLLASEERAG